MTFEDILQENCVVANLTASSKKQLFQDMADVLMASGTLDGSGINVRDIVCAAMERERLGTTGVGSGVALPHARLTGVDKVQAVFARLSEPLDYEAIDDRPVDLVVLLIAPENAGGEHLRALAMISRRLRREDVRARLRGAPDQKSLFVTLMDNRKANAA